MNQAIDFSTLTWVKNELDETLKEARQSLEAYVEDNSDTAQPGFLAAHLHQVYGTLQMVELYGAALLAEEMEQVAKAIADGSVTRQNDACDVLMRAILQLPDYLDRLISGCQDIPLVLLPVLNDLRAVRGANLLSENVMFSPDLDAALPDNVSNYTVDGDLAADIKDLRHRFQIGLLGWFRGGGNEQQSLEALSSVLDTLHGLCAAEPVARFWWVAAGVVDAVLSGSLNGSASVKRLMGQVDRQIKRLVDHGEQVLVKEPATDVMKNLLFYVAQSSGGIERIDAIQSTYRLQELLPGEEEMAAARESLSGQNSDLFATVAVAVKEELARLKDQLDIALRNGCEDTDALQEMVQSLGSLGDTLGMLSLGEARTAVVSRVKELGTYLQAGDAPPSTVLMDMANTLLFVESSVESMGSGRSVDVSEDSVDEHLAKSEFNQVMDVVLREAITDLARAKEAIVGYTSGGDEADGLAEVPQWFNQVKGGLLLLEETRAASIIDAAAKYIEDKLIPGDGESQEKELESLADAICGLEYYLESRREHRMYGDSAMDVAEKGIESLGYPVQADADEPTDMQVEDAAEREEELAPFDLDFDEVSGADELLVSNAPEVTGETGSSARNEEETVAEDVPVFPEMDADQDLPADESLTDVDQVESPAAGDVAVCVQEEDEGLAIIGDEIDEEILEIFIEEAEEEIESLSTLLPQWIKNNDNGEALETVRRSFHTLKGSGRLVGAMRIGEFAWAYENMLNRIIDGTIEVSAPVTDILGRVLDALVELVEQVKNGSPVVQPVSWLMQCADAISKGEEPPAAPDVSARTNVSDVEADAEEIPFIQGDQELTGADSDQPELVSSTQSEDAVDMAATDNSLIVDSVMDPMLYEIFNSESRGHLEVIRQFLGRVDNGDACIDDALTRALHTLHGSAHMAGSDPIADLAGELEQYTKQLSVAGVEIPEAGCAVLQETVAQIQDMLDVLPGEHRAPEGFDDLLSRIQVLRESSPTVPGETLFQEEMLESQAESDGENRPDESVDDQLYADIDPELLEIFLEESEENLETSDAALDRWRKDSEDHEALAELQRALHTVKGGARMAELGVVGDLAHAVESLIITVNDCGAAANDDALHGVQRAQDALVSVLDEVRNHKPMSAHDALISELQVLRENVMSGSRAEAGADDAEVVDEVASDADVEVEQEAVAEGTESSDLYTEIDPELLEVFLEEAADILEHSEETLQNWKDDAGNRELMAEFQRELHTLKGGSRMADITAIGDLSHAVESLVEKVAVDEVEASASMFSVLQDVHDVLVRMVVDVAERREVRESPELIADLETLREGRKVAARSKPEAKSEPAVQPMVVEKDGETRERRTHSRTSQELVRVKATLLDSLVNYAGEVSIYRSRLEQQVGAYRFNLVELEQTVARVREQLRKLEIETEAQVLFRYEREAEAGNDIEEFDPLEMDRYSHMQQLSRSLVESCSDLGSLQGLLDNITRESETLLLQQSRVNTELQEGLMRTRMVPFLGLAPRMRRIVRQTCQELGKQAELELSGAEGEMDRTVVDRIVAPIEHMLRNAISHGIEKPERRKKAGKPETGTIRITFERESSDVVLRITDDGAGISLDAIRHKAIERGLMAENAALSDNEVLQFILETGFSTADKVTQVSGRGVGMDVVNSEVKQLGGSLHIDSTQGQGTTFTIRLPFTLALNQALLIEVGEDTYAVPLSSVEGIVRMRREDLKSYYDDPDSRFEYGGYEYEVRHLGSVLGTYKPNLDSGQKRLPVLLARTGDHGVAFHVENLLGSREIVVKSVGPQISTVRGVSGATILGDGRVVMILDMVAMLRASGYAAGMMDQVQELMQNPEASQGVTVMVVDDSITVRKVTTRLLERHDMNVISAKDGVDAVSKLQDNIPDIMLLDIEMPRMDGFELATHIRNEPRLRHIPIIMITSRTGDKHRQRAMQIGVNRYLGKPFQEIDLMQNITELLEE